MKKFLLLGLIPSLTWGASGFVAEEGRAGAGVAGAGVAGAGVAGAGVAADGCDLNEEIYTRYIKPHKLSDDRLYRPRASDESISARTKEESEYLSKAEGLIYSKEDVDRSEGFRQFTDIALNPDFLGETRLEAAKKLLWSNRDEDKEAAYAALVGVAMNAEYDPSKMEAARLLINSQHKHWPEVGCQLLLTACNDISSNGMFIGDRDMIITSAGMLLRAREMNGAEKKMVYSRLARIASGNECGAMGHEIVGEVRLDAAQILVKSGDATWTSRGYAVAKELMDKGCLGSCGCYRGTQFAAAKLLVGNPGFSSEAYDMIVFTALNDWAPKEDRIDAAKILQGSPNSEHRELGSRRLAELCPARAPFVYDPAGAAAADSAGPDLASDEPCFI